MVADGGLVVQIDWALFFSAFHHVETSIGQIRKRRPKIPEGQIIFRRQRRHVTVDALILFTVIGFGSKNRHDTGIQQLQDNLPQILGITRLKVGTNLNDDKRGTMNSQLALDRRLRETAAIFSSMPLRPQQRSGGGPILGRGTLAVE